MHTSYSDGPADVREIVQIARRAGLDFVVIADHDTTAAREDGWEGVHDGVAIIVAFEITSSRRPHCMAWGVECDRAYGKMRQEAYIRQITNQGGACFAAHPMGRTVCRFPDHVKMWRRWSFPGLRGMEVWSFAHAWLRDFRPWQVQKLIRATKHPEKDLPGPAPSLLQRWDSLGKTRRFVGMSALDAHARRIPLTNLHFLPYYELFKSLRLHVKCGPSEELSAATIQGGIEQGRCFMANDSLGESSGFDFSARDGNGRRLEMGSEIKLSGSICIEARIPGRAEVVLLRGGRLVASSESGNLTFAARRPGVYRIEARRKDRPWIFSNPIYLRT